MTLLGVILGIFGLFICLMGIAMVYYNYYQIIYLLARLDVKLTMFLLNIRLTALEKRCKGYKEGG